jgi:Abortive infection C-terminus
MSSLARPDGLDSKSWEAIESQVDRLLRAERDRDLSLMIGSAKDLVETVAKIVLELSGEVAPSDAELPGLLTKAHSALDRQPGQGAASDTPVRNIAQGAKSIISQLPELRNRFGTGHGRVLPVEMEEELAPLCMDAALLWSRWALRRLGHLLARRPLALVTALQEGIFYRGDLRKRLQAIDLPELEAPDQRLLGVAVGHRAMRDTFVVKDEGVEACALQPDLLAWPIDYRAGLVEALFLDREGYVDTNAWAAKASAAIIAPAPTAAQFLEELASKAAEASWAYRFASDASVRAETVAAMRDASPVLPNARARNAWERIVRRLDPDPWLSPT